MDKFNLNKLKLDKATRDKLNLDKIKLSKLNLEEFKPDKATLERLNLKSLKPSKPMLGKAARVANILFPLMSDNWVPGDFPSKPDTPSRAPAVPSSASGRSGATAPGGSRGVETGRRQVGEGKLSTSLLDKYLPDLPLPLRLREKNAVASVENLSSGDEDAIGRAMRPRGGVIPEGTWLRGRHIEVTDSHAPSPFPKLPARPNRQAGEHRIPKPRTRQINSGPRQGGYEYVAFTHEDASDYTAGPARTVLASDGVNKDCVALLLTPELSGLVKESVNLARLLKRDEEYEGMRRANEQGKMEDLRVKIAGCEKILTGEGVGAVEEANHELRVVKRKLKRLETRRQRAHDKLWDRAEEVRRAEQSVLAVLEGAFVAAKLIIGGKEPVPPVIGESRVGLRLESIKEDQTGLLETQAMLVGSHDEVPQPKQWRAGEAGPSHTQAHRGNGPEDALRPDRTREEQPGQSNTQARHGKAPEDVLKLEQPKGEWPASPSPDGRLPTLLSKSFEPSWPLAEQPVLAKEPSRTQLLSLAHEVAEPQVEQSAFHSKSERLPTPPSLATARAERPSPLFSLP